MPRPQKAHAEPMWLISQAKFWPKKAGPRAQPSEGRGARHPDAPAAGQAAVL
jgi:hypothetical protein